MEILAAIVGIEALVRWNHPTWGPIAPMAFMPLAEQTDLMKAVTDHVLDKKVSLKAYLRGDFGALLD